MPERPEREYRSFNAQNMTAQEDGYIVEGYATTFDDPYELYPGYFEAIDRHALDGADMTDVIFQYDHEGAVMARQRNNTLSVMCDDHGLMVRADLGGSAKGRELYEAIKNGLVDRMSWAFVVDDEGWQHDAETSTTRITKVRKVYDVSAVSIPANDGTEINARSRLYGAIQAERLELAERKEREEKDAIAARLTLASI